MNFLSQTLIVEKLLEATNKLLPELPENEHKKLLINALHAFEGAITPSAIYLDEVHDYALKRNLQVTSQQALEILENVAFDIDLNYVEQAIEYHIDQFLMD